MLYTKEQYLADKAIVESAPKLFADRYEFYSERDHAFYTSPDEANIAISYYIATGSTSYEASVYIDYGNMQRLDDLRDKIELYETVEKLSERLIKTDSYGDGYYSGYIDGYNYDGEYDNKDKLQSHAIELSEHAESKVKELTE